VNDVASEVSDVEPTDGLKYELQATIEKQSKQVPKSAPTSANGSSNPNPTLDIQFTLPREPDSEDDGIDMNSDTRRERR